MSAITSECLKTGVDALDDEHQRLFQALQRVRVLAPTDVAELQTEISRLTAFIDAHISYEEQMMSATQYPRAAEHVNQHATMRGELRVLTTLAYYGFSDAVRMVVVTLSAWIQEHIEEHDRKFADFMRENHTGTPPNSC